MQITALVTDLFLNPCSLCPAFEGKYTQQELPGALRLPSTVAFSGCDDVVVLSLVAQSAGLNQNQGPTEPGSVQSHSHFPTGLSEQLWQR